MPRESGASSTPWLLESITDVSGILVHPLSRVMTVRDAATTSRSRRMFCARLILNFPPSEDQRAQGMPGARCARSLACKSESSTHASRHGHTGNTRHSPRNGLRLISRSPRGPGSFAPVVRRANPATLTPASGRQDHTTSRSRGAMRPNFAGFVRPENKGAGNTGRSMRPQPRV